ncbi:MAG: hypothetical protein ACOYY3_20180 [Chloroflexota bacterium]
MYGSFQNQISSAAKWVFFGFIVIVVIAILLGGNIKEATWLNSSIAEAEAERIQIESAHQQATYELQERLAAAQTEAEIQQIQREQKMLDARYEHDMKILAQDVVNRQRWTDAGINLVIFVGGSTGIAAAISALIVALAKAISILRTTPKGQPAVAPSRAIPEVQIVKPMPERHADPDYEQMRINAKQRELLERGITLRRMKVACKTPHMTKEQYDRLPHAE